MIMSQHAKAAVIGYYRSGATVEQIRELTGYLEITIRHDILQYLKEHNELPNSNLGSGDNRGEQEG